MAMLADEDDPQTKKNAQIYIARVKERFHGRTADKFEKFKTLLTHPTWSSHEDFLSKVESLFAGNDDLIQGLRDDFLPCFQPNSSSNSSNVNAADKAMEAAVKLINRVKSALKDERDLFQSFIKIVARFKKHQSAHLLKKQIFDLLEKHPALKIELSGCLAEGIERKAGSERAKIHKEMVCVVEDDLAVRHIRFHRMRFAKESAERLIVENTNLDLEEQIDILGYFSALDIKCLKDEMRSIARIFSRRLQTRRKAVQCSNVIVSRLNEKINMSKRGWSEEKKVAFEFCVDQESEIQTWDWH